MTKTIKTPLFLLIISFLSHLPLLSSILCDKILDNNAFFSLKPLISSSDFTYEYTENNLHYRLYYSFCGLTVKKCKEISAYALLYRLDSLGNEENSTCIRLSSTSTLSNFAYSLNNPDDASNGIQLSLSNGDAYSTNSLISSLNYQAIFKIFCTKNSLPVPFLIDEITNDQNQYLIIGRSLAGCPIVENSTVYQFIYDNRIVIGIIMIIIGFIECFFGLAIIKETIFFVGFLASFGFLMMIFGEFFLNSGSSVLSSWILLLISILIGGSIGYISTSLPKIGFMCMGFWIGFILGFIVNNLFLYKIEIEPPGLLLYVIMGIFGCIFGLLSACLWRHICILGTSFLGAYLVIRCLAMYIGSYPNELSVPKQIKFKEIEYVDWPFYIYFIFLMLLTAMGMMLQFRNKRKIGGRFAGKYYEDLLEDEESTKLKKKSGKFNEENDKNHEENLKKTESEKDLKFSSRNKKNDKSQNREIEIEMPENGRNEEEDEENREVEIIEGDDGKKKKKKKKKHHRHHKKREESDEENKRQEEED